MKRGSGIQCVELIPGEPLQEVPKKQNEEPPEGFVDNIVYRYKLDENGNKVFLGTMPAFPEGWNIPKEFKKKGEGKMSKDKRNLGPRREDREQIMERVRQMMAEGGSVSNAAKELNVPVSTVYTWLAQEKKKAQKQAQEPVLVQVGNQEPERENQEPAEDSITPEATEKVTPPKNDGFGLEDEPIPYTVTDYVADHYKIALEIVKLLDRKRADYGTENIRKFGSYGVLVRVSDKVERLINLSGKEPNFETTEDTWKDIAGYAILALIELREGR